MAVHGKVYKGSQPLSVELVPHMGIEKGNSAVKFQLTLTHVHVYVGL